MKQRLDLSAGWQFKRGRAGSGWVAGREEPSAQDVDLPHCWNATDTFQPGVEYYRGRGAYRKAFSVPPEMRGEGGAWILESGGFYGTGEIMLNGEKVADVDGEYLGIRLDVGPFLRPGAENLLAVLLTNRCRSHVLPGIAAPDFLLYGGLAGRMTLARAPALCLEESSLRIEPRGVLSDRPAVTLGCAVRNSSAAARRVRLRWTLFAPDGSEAGAVESPVCAAPPASLCEPPAVELPVDRPELWSPDSPALYSLRCEALEGVSPLDREARRIGFRLAEFRPGRGFFLNGRRVELRGCNRHESMPGFGNAIPDCLHAEDARLLKETGFNFVRLSHYPQHPAFLDACDELGIMVYAEIATWKSVRTGRWLKSALRQMERLVRRDRHRPCVILWGMGNESRSRPAYIALRDLARELDPDRPVIYAENHLRRAKRANTVGLPDVWGCNYETGVLDEARGAARLDATLVSEFGNMPSARRGETAEELKQVEEIERGLSGLEAREFNAGWLLWCMNDYSTLRKKRYMRFSGMVDAWRLPKMSRAFLQALCLEAPFVQLFADWGAEGGPVPREIFLFTNCERTILLRNGAEVFAADGGARRHSCRVRFEPGVIEARGWKAGREVAARIVSWGAARRIELRPETDRFPGRAGAAVGIAVRVLDDAGALCGGWLGEIGMQVEGPAVLRAYAPGGRVQVAAGLGRGFLAGTGSPGRAALRASCDPLLPGFAEVLFA